jgi:hypothetical protein
MHICHCHSSYCRTLFASLTLSVANRPFTLVWSLPCHFSMYIRLFSNLVAVAAVNDTEFELKSCFCLFDRVDSSPWSLFGGKFGRPALVHVITLCARPRHSLRERGSTGIRSNKEALHQDLALETLSQHKKGGSADSRLKRKVEQEGKQVDKGYTGRRKSGQSAKMVKRYKKKKKAETRSYDSTTFMSSSASAEIQHNAIHDLDGSKPIESSLPLQHHIPAPIWVHDVDHTHDDLYDLFSPPLVDGSPDHGRATFQPAHDLHNIYRHPNSPGFSGADLRLPHGLDHHQSNSHQDPLWHHF